MSAVLKYIKLAFNYEYWDYYTLAVSHLVPLIEVFYNVDVLSSYWVAEIRLYLIFIEVFDYFYLSYILLNVA